MVDFPFFRIGHAGARALHQGGKNLAKRASCTTGGFYLSPTAGVTIDSQSQLNITWDHSCMSSSEVDIYLYSPGSSQSIIHLWEGVYNTYGNYQTQLKPQWWNSTSSVQLYLTIVPHNVEPFMATIPAGPVFTATYSASASDGSATAASGAADLITNVNNNPANKHGTSKGAIAAAVIVPLLIIGLLIAGCYIRIRRGVEKDKRRRFSAKVDERMSTINPDWQSLSGAGANAAIRNSMSVNAGNNRISMFEGSSVRPLSTVATDGGRAGIGARTVLPGKSNPEMSQLRSRVPTSAVGSERVSRVSFAPDTRPSLDSRKSAAMSRAYHTPIVPPLPIRQDSDISTPSGILSPTQTAGPLPLSADDIQARFSGQAAAPPSMEEVMPALRMMVKADEVEELFVVPETPMTATPFIPPTVPSPIHVSPSSPSAMSTFMPMPATVASMSPDDMLRAYAGRRVASPPLSPSSPSMPAPTYGNMAPLYALASPLPTSPPATVEAPRKSVAATEGSRYSQYSAEDVYSGTAA